MDRGSFTDRVMARVAEEPTPSPGRVFMRSLRRFAVRDALGALAAAWRLAFEPASSVATSARAASAALFLSVIIVVGIGGAFATGGALMLLGPDGDAPQELAPAAPPTEAPAATIQPTPSPTPAPTPTPSPTPTPTPWPTLSPSTTPLLTPSVIEQAPSDSEDRAERETPEPDERQEEKNEKRETPEPKEREEDERDEKDEPDERDERDDKDEREDDD